MQDNPIFEFIQNPVIWTAVAANVSAQVVKGLLHALLNRKWAREPFFTTGGMPSSHSAFVAALAISVGAREGFDSAVFALSLVFAVIVMFDAAGVRRAAGKQAQVLNRLLEMLNDQGIALDVKLKELLGHSPLQVIVGAIWGFIVAAFAVGVVWA